MKSIVSGAAGAAACLALAGPGVAGGPAVKTEAPIVFVCEHGSVKSLIAAQWFNRLAAERGLAVRAVSRGLTPDAAVPPSIAAGLRADGFDVQAVTPQALAAADLEQARRVIAMGARVDRPGKAVEQWDDIPPATLRYEESRTVIRKRIEALLDELKQQP